MAPIRIVLADDHPIVLHGLAQLFGRHADLQVVVACADGPTAVASVLEHHPDILVVDLRMDAMSGLDVLRHVAREAPECRSILLTAAVSDEEVVEAMRLGARALILKDESPEVLIDCVRRVHRGEQWIERDKIAGAFARVLQRESQVRAATASLTPRETEVVRMVARGLRNRVIAEQLAISEGTVKVHLHNIFEKCGLDGRLELALYAQENGLS